MAAILERSPADIGLLAHGTHDGGDGGGVFVPFGGEENDWAALEFGAWLARATAASLTLVAAGGAPRRVEDASLAVERVVGIRATPLDAEPSDDALLAAVQPAGLVVAGLSSPRLRLVRAVRPPLLLVHRGPRPGGLAPSESRTQFSWSVEG